MNHQANERFENFNLGEVFNLNFARTYSNAPWEGQVGYCRTLKAGNHIFVTGTAPINPDGTTHAPRKPYEQAVCCLKLIQKALKEASAEMSDVVRTRMFETNIDHWEVFGNAHKEFFERYPPNEAMRRKMNRSSGQVSSKTITRGFQSSLEQSHSEVFMANEERP